VTNHILHTVPLHLDMLACQVDLDRAVGEDGQLKQAFDADLREWPPTVLRVSWA
jgi:hypothetical protein